MPKLFTVIASGFNISADIDLTKVRLAAIQAPVIDSADLAFRGGFDSTSALFTRVCNASGDVRIPVQAGSRSLAGPRETEPFAYLRLETLMPVGSAQTNPRTFTLLTQPRT